ncbi:MAG: FAD binding domain-containing protein [Pseudorhodobacter sp.]|nr:FAD binding domain-containing protein [Pseudorhodobacter sp.]
MTDYARPMALPEALGLLSAGKMQLLAGGTDIYPALAGASIARPVLDIAALPGLRGITAGPEGLRIGACTTWEDIAQADLPPALAALRQAAVQVGGRQIQHAGTIGGNLCNASPAADGVPPLLVVGAEVELVSARGLRRLALGDFLIGPRQTARAADEVLVAVLVPQAALAGQSRFLKLGARAWLVISIAMVAVRLVVAGGLVVKAALAVGACSAVARRLPEVESALIGAPLADAATRIVDTAVAAALDPMDDLRGSAVYRAVAAAELLRRAVADIAEGAA